MRRLQLSVAALAIAAVAPVAHAQKSAPSAASKFTVDLHVGGAQLSPEHADSKSGGGAGLGLGYDVTPALRLGLGMDVAKIDYSDSDLQGNFALVNFDIGARYAFVAPTRRWSPFLAAAVTPRSLGAKVDDGSGSKKDLSGTGTGYTLGAGVDYSMSPKMAFSGALNYTGGKFDSWKYDGQDVSDMFGSLKASGMRVNVGLTFHPFAGR